MTADDVYQDLVDGIYYQIAKFGVTGIDKHALAVTIAQSLPDPPEGKCDDCGHCAQL